MTIMCCVWDIHCNWFKISDWDQKINTPFALEWSAEHDYHLSILGHEL